MGDLVQIYQSCLDFKNQHKNIELKLIARKSFAEPLKFLLDSVFDEILYVPAEEFSNESSFSGCLEQTRNFLNNVNEINFDVLLNFSFCETSNYLSSCINASHKLGTTINKRNEVSIHDQWSQVIHALVQRGPYCPYNLVDLFKNILGIRPTITNPEPPQGSRSVKTLAIHPFASHKKKRWKEHKWAEIIYNFLKENSEFKVAIYGTKNEASQAQNILDSIILKNYKGRIINNVGKFNLEDTFNSISKCHTFIGHDSLLGHLAKVSGLPTLTISLGTVRENETIPYGEKSFILSPKTSCYPCFPNTKCDNYACHADIPYQTVCNSLNLLVKNGDLSEKVIKENISPFHLNGTNIYKAEFSSHSWLYLKEISGNQRSIRDVMKTLYRMCFSYQFEGLEETFPTPTLSNSVCSRLESIQEGIKQLYELSEFGKKYSKYILAELAKESPSLEDIQKFSEKIDDIDKLSELVKKTHSELTPMIEYYMVTKSNLIGDSLVEISESSYLVYNDQANSSSIIYELINSLIRKTKMSSSERRILKNG